MYRNLKKLSKIYTVITQDCLCNNRLAKSRTFVLACQHFSSSTIYSKSNKKDDSSLSTLFTPVPIKPNPDDINIGAELSRSLDKVELLKILNKFSQKKEVKLLCMENGLDSNYQQ